MSVLMKLVAGICLIASLTVSAGAAELPTVGRLAAWNFDQDEEGWKAAGDCELSVSDGVLRIVGIGNNPHLAVDVSAPAGWKEISLLARFRGRLDGQFFWATADEPEFDDARSTHFSFRSRDREWQEYKVFINPDSALTALRFDPADRRCRVDVQWIALAANEPPMPQATPVKDLKLLDGFKAELLYSVPGDQQGSWVSLTTDDRGRLLTSDQYGQLYRITPPAIGADAADTKVEPLDVDMGMCQGLLYAFDSLYCVVNGGRPYPSGLYRLRDTSGDDQFDEVKMLRKIDGGGEHGPHAVILAPDGKSIYVCGGNHTKIPDPQESRVPRNWDEDFLLGRQWDARGHAAGVLAPGGWICRVDPDGETFELVSSGYRNEYDIAFNPAGELFTYDADMEWDVGAPWYRPTRVCHATSGSEFGWRSGTGKWPVWYPDSLPPVVDIGPGSPTGIVFGTGAKFPAKYQRALFICDWSYGQIHAIHLTPKGSTYVGQAEPFVSAAPLPATDIIVNPHDGALYFTIGGRRTQSGLYRITYAGPESTEPAPLEKTGAQERALRHKLEALHGGESSGAIAAAWPYLGHSDRFIRFAARIAVEHQPVDQWQAKALAEKNPASLITAMIALARCGDKAALPKMIDALGRAKWNELAVEQQLELCRAYQLAFIRLGRPDAAHRAQVLSRLDEQFPAKDVRLNRELCQLLVYLEAPGVVRRTLALLAQAPTQEEQIHYAFCLRGLASDWTLEDRQEYFGWFNRAAAHRGGASFGGFLSNIRKEAIAALSDDEKLSLQEILDAEPQPQEPDVDVTERKFVKKWTVEELLPSVDAGTSDRDLENGRKLFAAALCFKCHRFKGQGGTNGPDLTGVGRRFNAQNLLESLIEPSKVISDQYQATMFMLDDGRTLTGRVANLNGDNLMVNTNMLEPGELASIRRGDIEEMRPSPTSMMPAGLLDTFTKDEILDLVAYLRSAGEGDELAAGE